MPAASDSRGCAVNQKRVLLVSDVEVEKSTEERAMASFAAISR
jgi:hypothetical protein